MVPMSLTAYAARRGVSPKAVSKAVAAGRLAESVTRDAHGQPKIADAELADREWSANTRQRADPEASAAAPPREPAALVGLGAAAIEPTTDRSTARSRRPGDLPEGVPTYHVSQAIRAASAARRESAQADLAELELAQLQGKLVDADEAHAEITAHISMAKTRLLGVPTRVAQEVPDLAARVVPVVDRFIREALEELTHGGGE